MGHERHGRARRNLGAWGAWGAWLGAVGAFGAIVGCSDGSQIQTVDDLGSDIAADARDTHAPADTTTSAETVATSAETVADSTPADSAPPLDTSPSEVSKPSDVEVADEVDETTVPPETVVADTMPAETEVLPVGGEDCTDPPLLTDDDHDGHYDIFADVGALSHLRDDYDALACGITDTKLNGDAKADAVWRFVAPSDGEYRVSLLSDTNIDLILYVFDAAACGTTCLAFDDHGGAADIDSLVLTLTKDQAVSIVVDGKAAWHAGAYIVDVFACGASCD